MNHTSLWGGEVLRRKKMPTTNTKTCLTNQRLKPIYEDEPLIDTSIPRRSPVSVTKLSETTYESFSDHRNQIRDALIEEDNHRCYELDCFLSCLLGRPIRFKFDN